MAPLTRSAASFRGNLRSQVAQPPKEPEIIDIDEQSVDDEEMLEEEGEEIDEDEEMDDLNGDAASDTGSVVPVSEPSLKSVMGATGKPQDTPELFTAAGAQEALHPLRRTADRVTRQIEAFAEKLDQFKRKNTDDEFQRVQAAYKLVESYRDLAQNAIQEVARQQTLKRAKMGFRASESQDTEADAELNDLQLEANTWRLLLNLISIDDPASRASFKEGRQTAFQNLHRYSSDREIWEQFLNADHYALECVVAMRWLEETSKTGDQEMEILITDMEAQAERGQGLWAHGWLFTKEAIKGHKRLRAWPQPLEPNDPGISRSLLSTEEQKPLITQLDPDALARQRRSLEKQDGFYERATWMMCWKMLRQGESWTKIRDWAQGRLESWRAVSLCGSSVDPHTSNTRTPVDDGMTRFMSSKAHDSWRDACFALTQNPNTEDFQRAVYGLLCGETEPAAKVCRNWDDYLYVYFNRAVLSRYQGFCRQFQRKLSHSPNTPVVFKPEPAGHADLQKFIQYLRGNEKVAGDAHDPFRNLQATILSKGYDSYFPALAQAVSQVSANRFGASTLIPDVVRTQTDEPSLITADDDEALKVAAHVLVVINAIGYARADSQFFETASVVVAGYIATLEEKGLYNTIPLYASLLPTEMAHSVFSKILIDVVDPRTRMQLVRLMKKHGIDVEAVLDTQWSWLAAGGIAATRRHFVAESPQKDLIGTAIADEDEKMIRSLEWRRSVGDQWSEMVDLGAWLYRKFYVANNLAAARELSHRMSLEEMSQEIFGYNMVENPPAEDMFEEEDVLISQIKLKRNGTHRRSLSGSSTTGLSKDTIAWYECQRMLDFERITLAFDGLEKFAMVHEQISKIKRRRDSGTVKDLTLEVKELIGVVESQVSRVVEEWLPSSENAEEEKDYEYIRRTYLPDLFLDYHNAVYFASACLNQPNLLVQCMELSVHIANSPQLTRSFTDSRRMAELVDALALSSKALVISNAKNDHYVDKKHRTPGIWRVDPPDEGEHAFLQGQ
ncbi:hypothetical protein NUU61_006588 [Penicillium alfredii]|uniref:Nuclear pore complex protein n=1 Tax=Penicillium alfredii TaxID=1506179 RepID=A0A9W9F136_9EURO|nr:uncharacterized protein NUU61_006588 [Penicillium alfredii]KAJ5091718.1 hypothetical protein NUU61_006588 [Penicillium alfredii]